MLAIQQNPVEARVAQHLHQLRRGKHQRATQRGPVGADQILHPVRPCHANTAPPANAPAHFGNPQSLALAAARDQS